MYESTGVKPIHLGPYGFLFMAKLCSGYPGKLFERSRLKITMLKVSGIVRGQLAFEMWLLSITWTEI